MATGKTDFVIYGASGFTGQYVVREVVNKAHVDKKLTWAVAGRSRAKIQDVLTSVASETGDDLSSIKIILADSGDHDSLVTMASQAHVVLNCVGPYRNYGEPVVRACVETGTHHVDISGEPEYMENMELKYNSEAKENGAYVISSCGFDSIPNDMGLVFAKQNFEGKLASVESYLSLSGGPKGIGINTGTWNTLVQSISNWKELTQLRKQMPKVTVPKPACRPKQGMLTWFEGDYFVPFQGADKSVVYRTQRDDYLTDNTDLPVNDNMYVKVGSMFNVIKGGIFFALFGLMCMFSYGRDLLIKYPSFFSGGLVYTGGPPKDVVLGQKFDVKFKCSGYSSESEGQGRPDKTMTMRCSGPDPGYIATSSCLVESGYSILREKDKMPGSGGVMTTGHAFKDTTIIHRLADRNIKFEVIPN